MKYKNQIGELKIRKKAGKNKMKAYIIKKEGICQKYQFDAVIDHSNFQNCNTVLMDFTLKGLMEKIQRNYEILTAEGINMLTEGGW